MDEEQLLELEKTLIATINGNDDDDIYIAIGFQGLVKLCEALIAVREAIGPPKEESWFFS